MKKTTIYIPEDLAKSVTVAARKSGTSEAALIREAISSYVIRLDRPLPRIVGAVSDGSVQSTNIKQWIRENWKP